MKTKKVEKLILHTKRLNWSSFKKAPYRNLDMSQQLKIFKIKHSILKFVPSIFKITYSIFKFEHSSLGLLFKFAHSSLSRDTSHAMVIAARAP